MKYWINTVSKSHVLRGVEGGFTQANHGRQTGLKGMARGDRLVFYAPRTDYPDGEPLRRFVAIGEVTDEAPYQAQMTPTFEPWRRNVRFAPCEETPIEPLIEGLDFIQDKKRWGFPFRRGLFEVSEHDFALIAAAMGVSV
jgi:hypothetical protein